MGQRETRDEDRVCGTRSAVMDPNGPETTGHERRDDCHQHGYQQARAGTGGQRTRDSMCSTLSTVVVRTRSY